MDVLPHGSWPSSVSARDTVAGQLRRDRPHVDDGVLTWLETRPVDDGRTTLVRLGPDGPVDVSLPGQDVRTRFQEYGGGASAAEAGLLLYVVAADQRVWVADGDAAPRPVTPDVGGLVRWSCFRVDRARRSVVCLREDQRDPAVEPVTSLVRISPDGPNDDLGRVLVPGRVRPLDDARASADDGAPDFVADPALSPDGRRLAWVSWDHPAMAWTSSRLHVGRLDDDGDLHDVVVVAGGDGEAVEQPRWRDDDHLLLLSDRSGWSTLHVADLSAGTAAPPPVTALHDDPHDHGQPRWTPDQSSYDLLPDGCVVSARVVAGAHEVCVHGPAGPEPVDSEVTFVTELRTLDEHHVVCRAFFADRPAELVAVDLRDGSVEPVGGRAPVVPDPAEVSRPRALRWPADDGAEAHGFLYPPANDRVRAPEGALPPLVVTAHGGPTASAQPGWSAARTFWTSRGFAVLDVNYAGSTGYGRAYRERLDGTWGLADVADVVAGVRHLVDTGLVDGARVVVTGRSAGGFTTLAALTSSDVFAAGASHFGVGDLGALARDTHKLESRYTWGLVAPWPEGEQVYVERSPLTHVDRLTAPLILLQGDADKVVPPAQAASMAEALRARGLPVALVVFAGEGHGFARPDHQVRALECELSFYGQVLGFEPADDLVPVDVENLPPR